MKICFFASAESIHSVRWIKFFLKKNKIIWISFAQPIPEAVDLISSSPEIKFFYLPMFKGALMPLSLTALLLKAKKIIKKELPEIIHSHSAGTYGFVCALMNSHPLFLTVWGSDVLISPNNYIRKKITKFTLSRADLITVDGRNAQKVMIEKFGVKENKIHFIQFGIDTKNFSLRPNVKKLYDLISLRSLEPLYDVETLVKAVNIVKKEVNDIKCAIAGGGSEEERLKKLAVDLELEENIFFLGRVKHYNLPQMLNSSKIYISTSLSDSGLSMSTGEAMSSGLPVIVSDSSDNRLWIKDFENGFVVPVKNPEALAEKIIYLLKNEKKRNIFGKKNRKLIEEKNNYYKEMEKVKKLYEEFYRR